MAIARIFQRPKSSTQSGRARTDRWQLEYVVPEGQGHDPLTGWLGGGDTRGQLRLTFPSRDAAVAYATAQGLAHEIVPTPPARLKLQAYADNFR